MNAKRAVRRSVRGRLIALVAIILVAGIGFGGARLATQTSAGPKRLSTSVGRTGSVCTVHGSASKSSGGSSDGASASASASASSLPGDKAEQVEIAAVTARQRSAAAGSLTGRTVGNPSGSPAITVSTPGQGSVLRGPQGTVLLDAEGAMASTSAGAVYTRADNGEDRGLQLGPCVVPGVDEWLTGLGARSELRSTLVLTNPDAADAVVDLRLYGEDGPITAAGVSGLTVPADGSRSVSLADLINAPGPVSVEVRASVGRVAVVAQDRRSNGNDPAGADFHPASTDPSSQQVIPGIPGGTGERTLSVVNPGQHRADVKVEVLGPGGAFAPAGAATVAVGAQSTGSVSVAAGLAGQLGTIRLTSDQPISAEVTSIGQRTGAADDLAVSVSQPAVGRVSLAPVAIAADSTSQLALSNSSSSSVTVSLQLFDLTGASLYTEDVPIAPNSTASRQLSQPAPAYLVLTVPNGSKVYAGIAITSNQDAVDGLAAAALITPDLSGRSIVVIGDPRVAR